MKNSKTVDQLKVALAESFALYIKTLNYHWHVKGPHFKSLHELFQGQYEEINPQLDEIAERIVTLGGKAPGTFSSLQEHATIKDGDDSLDALKMVADLEKSHGVVIEAFKKLEEIAANEGDSVTEDLAIGRTEAHQQHQWMLRATQG